MKVYIKRVYNLADEDEKQSYNLDVNHDNIISSYKSFTYEFEQWLRGEIKYNNTLSEEVYSAFEKIREKYYNLKSDYIKDEE